jgi:metallopeptidase MepB
MSDANDGIHFSLDELSGLSSASLAELQSNRSTEGQDSLWISFRAGSAILRDTTSSSTRKMFEVARDRRFPENVRRLQRVAALRDEIARLLGFDNHAELKSQEMMSASAEDTISTLKEMERRLRPLRDHEINEMLRLKQRIGCGQDENDDPSILYAWDWAFYAKQIRQVNYMLDKSKLAEYFEVNHTLAKNAAPV